MKSPEYFRQRSREAEIEYARAYWDRTSAVMARKSATESFHPHRRFDGQPVADTLAGRIYAHLKKAAD